MLTQDIQNSSVAKDVSSYSFLFKWFIYVVFLSSSALKWQRSDIMFLYCREMCVVFCKMCEAENVLIVVLIWDEVLLLGCYFSF